MAVSTSYAGVWGWVSSWRLAWGSGGGVGRAPGVDVLLGRAAVSVTAGSDNGVAEAAAVARAGVGVAGADVAGVDVGMRLGWMRVVCWPVTCRSSASSSAAASTISGRVGATR